MAPDNQGRPEQPASPQSRQPGRRPPLRVTSIPATKFAADLSTERGVVETTRWYWVGVLPDCPTDSLDFIGINFPKINEMIINGANGQQQRVPVIGALVKLYRAQLDELQRKLSRAVLRFNRVQTREEREAFRAVRRDVSNRGDPPRKGELVTIQTPEEVEERRKSNFVVVQYEHQPNDEPAADYVFAQLCDDQERGGRGSYYPRPLSETGISWSEQPEETAVA